MAEVPQSGGKTKVFGISPDTLKLFAAALIVSVALCGAEATFGGRRDIVSQEQYNQLILTDSMVEAIKDASFPPRVSPIVAGGTGVPYHQFYAPLSHFFAAIVSIIFRDLIDGFAYGSVLILSLAFLYAFRLGRYLTLSDHCAAVAAFIFVTAPYLANDRVLRGDFAEYFALCLLPMTLFYNLRALSLKSFKNWTLAVLATSALILSNLVIGMFFLLFYFLFHVMTFSLVLFRYLTLRRKSGIDTSPSVKQTPPLAYLSRFRHASAKSLVALSVGAGAVLLCMWHLGPATFYSDLMVKQPLLDRAYDAASGRLTPILSVFSVTDTSWNFKSNEEKAPRYQAGLVLLASYAAFLYYCARRRTTWALPFSITTGIVLLVIVRPTLLRFSDSSIYDFAQYSYRFLGFFAIAATVAGAVALRTFYQSCPGFTYLTRSAVALTLIALSIVSAAPYLYTRILRNQWVMYSVNTTRIAVYPRLIYGEKDYLRVPPSDSAGPEVWVSPDRKGVSWEGKPGDWHFRVDLKDYYRESGGPPGEVLLNVLYYPGLQTIDIFTDGMKTDPNIETYWQKMDSLGAFRSKVPGSFHGLKLTEIAGSGILEVRVRFNGFRWANWISFLSLASLVAVAVFRYRRKMLRMKIVPAGVIQHAAGTTTSVVT
jgi:hypothetical protein